MLQDHNTNTISVLCDKKSAIATAKHLYNKVDPSKYAYSHIVYNSIKQLVNVHIEFIWVKGHNVFYLNELADYLAKT